MKRKIVILGKTNTGKSTLFNKIIGYRKAIVLGEPGITRDRNEANFNWKNKMFTLIDTGGIDYENKKSNIQRKVIEQSKNAIDESGIVIFMIDVMTGILQEDIDFVRLLLKLKKKTILVVNKNDIKNKNYHFSDFFRLGIGDPIMISAEHGENIDKLLDKIVELSVLDEENQCNISKNIIKVAIIGKPNAGKSSILNCLMNEARMIVDDKPGTTRDSIRSSLKYNEYELEFIDTAGLRKKSNVYQDIEYYGNIRSIKSIKDAEIILFVIDASHYVSMQDKRIAKRIFDEKKACIILLNKYDIALQESGFSHDILLEMTRYELNFLKNITIITTIAVGRKKNINKILEKIIEIYKSYNITIPTPKLNNFLQMITKLNSPKMVNGKRLHFYYINQVSVRPPTFKLFVNNPELLYNSYKRYLENQFTKKYKLDGIPIVFIYKKR